jgi:phospholipase/carboxylesterase
VTMELAHASFVPAGPGPHPTVFAFHGFGSNAFDLLGLAPELLGGRALMIAPQAPEDVRLDAIGGAPVAGYGWFPLLPGDPRARDRRAPARAIELARGFVDEVSRLYPIDPDRTVVLGFSQGGVIAYGLALTQPERFRGVVALSSWLRDEMVAELPQVDRSRLAALVQHGTRDETVTSMRGKDSADKLRALGVRTTYREYDMAHEVSAQSVLDLDRWLAEQIG